MDKTNTQKNRGAANRDYKLSELHTGMKIRIPLAMWLGSGSGMPVHLNAFLPFRTGAVIINPESCAKSVNFSVSIANICEISSPDGFINGDTVDMWTHNNLGTVYDRPSDTDNGPLPH